MVPDTSTGRSARRPSWRTFTLAIIAFVLGAALGALASDRPRPARGPEEPNEIGVYIPDGKGGHDSPRLLVRSAHTQDERPGPLPPDEWQVILFYIPREGAPVRTVTYRAEKR